MIGETRSAEKYAGRRGCADTSFKPWSASCARAASLNAAIFCRAPCFLSHAKGDRELSVGIAEKIRTEALHLGQIDTFFDASELDWGEDWEKPMMTAAGERTAAFIAIFSDLYSSRYWCREELRRSPPAA